MLDLLLLILMILLLRGAPVLRPAPGVPGVLPITPEGPYGPGGPQTASRGGAGSAAARALVAALRSSGTESVQIPGGRTVNLPLGVRAALETEPDTYQSVLRSLAEPPPMTQLESAVAQRISQADPALLALLESSADQLPAAVRGGLRTRSATGQAMA